MFKALRTTVIATAIIASTGAVHAATSQPAAYGMAAENAYADRQITITADTKWVNVNGKIFTWHFDTLRAEDRFDLTKIAPAGMDVGMVTVYVASNPLYRG